MINFLILFLVCLLSTFSISYMYYKFSNAKKIFSYKIILLILFGSFFQTLIQYYNLTILSVISFFVYFPMLFIFINRVSLKRLVFYLMIIWFYGVIIDIIFALLLSLIFSWIGIYYNDGSILVSTVLAVSVSLILLFGSRSTFIKEKTNNFYKKIKDVRYTDMLLIVLAIFIICIDVVMVLNINNLSVNLLLIIVTVLMMMVFILIFKYKLNEEENKKYFKLNILFCLFSIFILIY